MGFGMGNFNNNNNIKIDTGSNQQQNQYSFGQINNEQKPTNTFDFNIGDSNKTGFSL